MTLRDAFLSFIKEWKNTKANTPTIERVFKKKGRKICENTKREANQSLFDCMDELKEELFKCCEENKWERNKDCSITIDVTSHGREFRDEPWITIRAKGISRGAKHGMYIVYVWNKNGTTLTAGIGFSRDDIIKRTVSQGCKDIDSVDSRSLSEFHKRIIDKLGVSSKSANSQGWQLVINEKEMQDFGRGMLLARKYPNRNKLSEKELKDDLSYLLTVYKRAANEKNEWNEYWGSNLDELFGDKNFEYSSDDFEEINRIIKKKDIPVKWPGKKEKTETTFIHGRTIVMRNPRHAAGALRRAEYYCEVEKIHKTFERPNGTNYVEPHHLIPLNRYRDFEYSVDVMENIVSLCSHCHNLLHYGRFKEKEPILEQLFEARKDALHKCGLDISLKKLKEYYK